MHFSWWVNAYFIKNKFSQNSCENTNKKNGFEIKIKLKTLKLIKSKKKKNLPVYVKW